MRKDPDCFLCSDLSDRAGSVAITHHFRLTSDIAPLKADHCLLYVVEHCLSLAQLSATLVHEASEAARIVSRTPMFRDRSILFFEHGPSSARSNIVGCCDHAHIHVLPTRNVGEANWRPRRLDYRRLLKEDEDAGKIELIATLSGEYLPTLRGEDYFWVAYDMRALDVYRIIEPERQYLRRVGASLLDLPKYKSWDLYDDDAARKTTQRLLTEIPTPGF